ncbi:MAG: Rnase Y domain-containing protein, partial [Erysipelotrichaceae bacterium]|nr:Rnase Y domain-containing protein [Erysipelotrichaceae bacterium]
MQDINLSSVLFLVIGLIIGIVLHFLLNALAVGKAKSEAKSIVDEANNQAKNTIKQAVLDGKTQVYDLKLQAEKEIKERKSEIQEQESKLLRREDSLNYRDENLTQKEKKLDEKLRKAEEKSLQLDKMEEELQSRIDGQIALLERVSNMSQQEAHDELMEVIEKKMENEVAAYIRDQEDEAKAKAKQASQEIIATAIQRYSQEETIDRTISVVTLPSEEMKGRIIGREGRNIRAIEQATGVDLIIDDTPEAITVSCFNPIRREIARQSLETLIKDGRIQPGRIEEVVAKVTKELDETIVKYGEQACFDLKIGKMNPELVK